MNRVNLGVVLLSLAVSAAAVVRAIVSDWAPFWPFTATSVGLAMCALVARRFSMRAAKRGADALAAESSTCAWCWRCRTWLKPTVVDSVVVVDETHHMPVSTLMRLDSAFDYSEPRFHRKVLNQWTVAEPENPRKDPS